MDGLKLLIWIVICFAPALFEYRIAIESKSLAQTQGIVTSVKNVPSVSVPIPGFVVSELRYSYKLNNQVYEKVQDSLPHLEYFTHVPNDLMEEFKTNTPLQVCFKLDDPDKAEVPKAAEAFALIAILQGALFAIGGSLLGLVFSLAATTYR